MKVKQINDWSLQAKLLLPVLFFMIALVVVILSLTRSYLNENFENETRRIILSKAKYFENNIKQATDQALFSAQICASTEYVDSAYHTFQLTHDLEKSALLIDQHIGKMSEIIRKYAGHEAKIHYHLPPARSFYRNYSKERGDDLSESRQTILQVNETKRIVSGIEVGRAGLALRGIAPVMDAHNRHLGSVEVFVPFGNVIKRTKSREEEELAVFIHTKKIKDVNMSFASDAGLSKQIKVGDYLLLDQTSDKFKTALLTENMIRQASLQEVEVLEKEEFKYAIIPIKDFSDKPIGIVLYQLDISENIRTLQAMNTHILLYSLLCLLIALSSIIYIVRSRIVKPITLLEQK